MNETTLITLDDILQKYLSKDALRENLQSVHVDGDCAYACNGHIGIEVPLSLISREYTPVDGYPNLKALLDDSTEVIAWVDANEMRTAIEARGMRPVYADKDCTKCYGEGEIVCDECGYGHKCKTCGGKGYIENRKVIGQEVDVPSDVYARLLGAYFNPNYLLVLCDTADTVDGVIRVTRLANAEEWIAMAFRIGAMRGVIMPTLANDLEDFIEIPT